MIYSPDCWEPKGTHERLEKVVLLARLNLKSNWIVVLLSKMENPDLADTQPIQPGADANRLDNNVIGKAQPPNKKAPEQKRVPGRRLPRWVWAFPIVILALLVAAGGALAGFNS